MSGTLFVGSYPPRECGIATFTRDVVESYDAYTGRRSDVVAICDSVDYAYLNGPRVVHRIEQGRRTSYYSAARFIDRHPSDVVNVQHEFGLFGGIHGEWCVDLVGSIRKPVALTMHTVLSDPEPSHLAVARALCTRADRVVVLAETGRRLLLECYGVAPDKIEVVPHGIPDVRFQTTDAAKAALGLGDRRIVSTFGLLSSGKGLEYAIEAVAGVARTDPSVLYLILGATHPVVLRAEGERYRASLAATIRRLGAAANIRMIDRYLTVDELIGYLCATDVYVTPYLNPEQIVSGTLAYALGAGRAIVSTPYLYARELLAGGRGLLAEFADPDSLAAAIRRLLSDEALRTRIQRRAYAHGRTMTWDVVASAYARICAELAAPAPRAATGATSV